MALAVGSSSSKFRLDFRVPYTAGLDAAVGLAVLEALTAVLGEEVFEEANVAAALAASVFHFKEIPIPALKSYLKQAKIEIR